MTLPLQPSKVVEMLENVWAFWQRNFQPSIISIVSARMHKLTMFFRLQLATYAIAPRPKIKMHSQFESSSVSSIAVSTNLAQCMEMSQTSWGDKRHKPAQHLDRIFRSNISAIGFLYVRSIIGDTMMMPRGNICSLLVDHLTVMSVKDKDFCLFCRHQEYKSLKLLWADTYWIERWRIRSHVPCISCRSCRHQLSDCALHIEYAMPKNLKPRYDFGVGFQATGRHSNHINFKM